MLPHTMHKLSSHANSNFSDAYTQTSRSKIGKIADRFREAERIKKFHSMQIYIMSRTSNLQYVYF